MDNQTVITSTGVQLNAPTYIPDMVGLDVIDSNPWQTRLEEDEAHVMTLARDIAANTLLQPGLGRRLDGRVQIAFAHSRLAAFKFLNVTGDAAGHFGEFPVIIRELSDRQMSDYAAAENAKRKNLSAIEVASAIQKRIADFGLTQLEAGEPFGYMSQSSVAHLLSLLKLPPQIKSFVNERLLPERLARRLVPFAVIALDTVIEIADKVAGAPDSERDDVFQDAVQELLDKHGEIMRDLWPLEWNAEEAMLDGERQAIAKCRGCDFRIMAMGDYHCARPTCYAVKKALWTEHELSRLSERLGLPIAGMDDTTIEPVMINWENDDRAKAYLKRKTKPDLYLMPEDGQLLPNSGSVKGYHHRLLDCAVVMLGSTNPHLFDHSDDKPANGKSVAADVSSAVEETPAADVSSAVEETPAARAKRIEREEAEAEERREARSAIRKARYDLVWLIMHNAEMLAVDLPITGQIAVYCADLTRRYTNQPQYEWPEYMTAYSPLEDRLRGRSLDIRRDADVYEVRRFILVRRFAYAVSGFKLEEQFNWTRGCKKVEDVAEELGLALPADWDQPPVHKTETNCHVCGVFAPGPTITGKDVERGWVEVDTPTGHMVFCSESCVATFNRTKPTKAKEDAARKSQTVKKVAAKKSQAKSKK